MSDPDQRSEELDEAVGDEFPPDRPVRLDDDGGTEPDVWEEGAAPADEGVTLAGDADIGAADDEAELVGRLAGDRDHGPLAADDEFTGDETTRDVATERVPAPAEEAAVHIVDDAPGATS
jgi:hypothetical protein